MTGTADSARAAELLAQARDLLERKEYYVALERVEQSLALREDPAARALQAQLLAAVGPL